LAIAVVKAFQVEHKKYRSFQESIYARIYSYFGSHVNLCCVWGMCCHIFSHNDTNRICFKYVLWQLSFETAFLGLITSL